MSSDVVSKVKRGGVEGRRVKGRRLENGHVESGRAESCRVEGRRVKGCHVDGRRINKVEGGDDPSKLVSELWLPSVSAAVGRV